LLWFGTKTQNADYPFSYGRPFFAFALGGCRTEEPVLGDSVTAAVLPFVAAAARLLPGIGRGMYTPASICSVFARGLIFSF
jgi:hypothetical protein